MKTFSSFYNEYYQMRSIMLFTGNCFEINMIILNFMYRFHRFLKKIRFAHVGGIHIFKFKIFQVFYVLKKHHSPNKGILNLIILDPCYD